MRIAFVIVPDFVFGAHSSVGGPIHGWGDEAVAQTVIVEGEGGRARIVASAPALRELGVRNGVTVASVRSLVGFVQTVSCEPMLVSREESKLAGLLLGASPLIHVPGGGAFWVGAGGWRLLGGEEALLDQIEELIVSTGYVLPRVGVADTVIAARAAAVHGLGVLEAGTDEIAMRPLPLSVLPLDERARESLWALGIRTVGAFSALPRSQIISRFGLAAERAHQLARAEDARTVPQRAPDDPPSIDVDFETPFDVVEPALFALKGGMESLMSPHRGRGFGIHRLRVVLRLINGGVWKREVRPADPVTDTQKMVDMCRAVLQDAELPAMMTGIRVSIIEVAPAVARQEGLWDGRRRRKAALDVTLMRLQSRLGPQAVKMPADDTDHHLPEVASSWGDVVISKKRTSAEASGGSLVKLGMTPRASHPHTAIPTAWRLLRPPERIGLQLERGRPRRAQLEGEWFSIRAVAGPQRIETSWWEAGLRPPIRRDYWYAELASGTALSLFCDLNTDEWHLQALLD